MGTGPLEQAYCLEVVDKLGVLCLQEPFHIHVESFRVQADQFRLFRGFGCILVCHRLLGKLVDVLADKTAERCILQEDPLWLVRDPTTCIAVHAQIPVEHNVHTVSVDSFTL